MKRIRVKSSLCVGICSLLMAFSGGKKSTLPDITKPYLGEYECKEAVLGGKDLLQEFSYLRLELTPDGKYIFHVKQQGKKKRTTTLKGRYFYDKETETLTLTLGEGEAFKREFPLRKGEIIVSLPLGNKQLLLKFEQR